MRSTYKNISVSSLLTTSALVGMLCFNAHAYEFTFTSPSAGSVYHVGDVMRIEFPPVDTSSHIYADALQLSTNNGKSFVNLHRIGVDSIDVVHHYDWLIPDSLIKSTGNISTVGDSCIIQLRYYQGDPNPRGRSALFSIKNATSIRNGFSFSKPPALTSNKRFFVSIGNSAQLRRSDYGLTGQSFFNVNGRLCPLLTETKGAPLFNLQRVLIGKR